MRKRIMSLLLCLIMALSLLPAAAVTAFAEETTQTGNATLIGFAAGKKAGDAYIRNDSMKIMDVPTGVDGQNPIYNGNKVGQTAVLSPYTPYGLSAFHPGYEYNDYSATAIVVQNERGSGTQRRLLKNDTFQPGVTYRFTFQDTSWPVNGVIKGGGYLGELNASNFTISGASVEKVERVTQQIDPDGVQNAKQGFFYNVWIKIDGTEQSHKVQYADNNVTSVEGLTGTSSSANKKTGSAKEGTKITVTAKKSKEVGSETLFFTGWKVTANGTGYTDPAYIPYYCNLAQFTSNTSGDPVTCTFLMGDKDIEIEALYGKPGSAGVGNVTFNNVKLWVTPPITGANGVAAAVPEFDGMGATYRIEKVEWLEDNETGSYNYLHMDPSKTFDTANKCYTMRVVLKMNSGYAFTDKNGVTITINGKKYGTGTENTLYNAESRTIPVTYSYSEANKSLAIYIPVGGAGVKTRLNTTRYAGQAALTFSDGKEVAAITSVEAYKADGTTAAATATAPGETLVLPAGKYTVKVNVTVSEAMHKLIQNNSGNGNQVTLVPTVMGLVNNSTKQTKLTLTGETENTANKTWTYTYSAALDLTANDQYLLAAGLNLKAKPLIPQYEYGEMRITDANLTTNAVIRGIADNAITGNVYYTNSCMFDKNLTTDVIGAQTGATLKYQWQKLSDGKWENISGATNGQYTPVADDVGKQIRVVVSAERYSGCIIGAAKTVEKGVWKTTDRPEAPRLAWDETNHKVTVNGAKENQDYILTDKAEVPADGEWTKGSDGLAFEATPNKTVYVYTRMADDDTHTAGTVYVYDYIYTGTTTSLVGITLNEATVNLASNGVQKIEVKPIPADATGWTDKTVQWYVEDTGSGIKLYADETCETEISTTSYISNKAVYIKVGSQVSNAKVKVQATDSGGYASMQASCTINVADSSGSYKLLGVQFYPKPVTAAPGDTVIINYVADPVGAALPVSDWQLQKEGGETSTAVETGELTVDNTAKTVTIKIPTGREVGTYFYKYTSEVGANSVWVTVTADTSTTSPDSVAPHTHTYDAYTDNGDGTHTATCTVEGCGARDYAFHIWSTWDTSDETKHTRNCTKCSAAENGDHSYVWVIDTPATISAEGKKHEECSVCGKKKSEDTLIPALIPVDPVVVSVAAPAHNGTAQNATPTGTGYTVANTVFYAPDGTEVMPGEKFAANTQYTAYVMLEAKVDEGYVFAMNKGETNVVYKINDKQYSGKTPAYSLFAYTDYKTEGGEIMEVTKFADSRDTITLTYEFQPTGQNSYYYHGGTTTTGGTKNSAATADPGVLLYGMMALSSYTGTALLVRGKKKHD